MQTQIYFTMQKLYIIFLKRNQNPSRCYYNNSVTKLSSFKTIQNYHLSKILIDLVFCLGAYKKSLKLLYSIMNLHTKILPCLGSRQGQSKWEREKQWPVVMVTRWERKALVKATSLLVSTKERDLFSLSLSLSLAHTHPPIQIPTTCRCLNLSPSCTSCERRKMYHGHKKSQPCFLIACFACLQLKQQKKFFIFILIVVFLLLLEQLVKYWVSRLRLVGFFFFFFSPL